MSFAEKVIHFFDKIESPQVPEYIEVMNPFITEEVRDVVDQFYAKYFNDNNPRRLIFGINPGRFGAGITGVPFTDPIRLEEVCNIPNSFHKRQETSSVFVYNFIEKYGGPEAFYKDYFITGTFPLGFIFEGKNINYYDDKALQESLMELIVAYLEEQLSWNVKTDVAYCLGKGKNLKFLQKLNKQFGFFGEIRPVPHPRWVMQYRYKLRDDFALEIADEMRKAVI
jgi:hypothetical protein